MSRAEAWIVWLVWAAHNAWFHSTGGIPFLPGCCPCVVSNFVIVAGDAVAVLEGEP